MTPALFTTSPMSASNLACAFCHGAGASKRGKQCARCGGSGVKQPGTAKTPGKLDTWADVSEFIFAGNATFTLVSLKTGVRFTYKVRVKKEDAERAKHVDLTGMTFDSVAPVDVVYFVNLLRGPNNEQDFAYMGVMRKPGRFFWTQASGKVGQQAPAYKAIVWMLDALTCGRDVLGRQLEVWHEGKCGCCARRLTVPESIISGYGPTCVLMRKSE